MRDGVEQTASKIYQSNKASDDDVTKRSNRIVTGRRSSSERAVSVLL